jgi:hypothetical protein
VRSDNFSSTLVQRLNAGKRKSPSPVQRSLTSGFLGRLGKTITGVLGIYLYQRNVALIQESALKGWHGYDRDLLDGSNCLFAEPYFRLSLFVAGGMIGSCGKLL